MKTDKIKSDFHIKSLRTILLYIILSVFLVGFFFSLDVFASTFFVIIFSYSMFSFQKHEDFI